MAKVVLHIGTHKTATTTVQDMFLNNERLLDDHGIVYPRIGRAAGHHGLVSAWNPFMPSIYALPKGPRGTLRAIAEKYADTDKTVFISSEEFSRGAEKQRVDFTDLKDLLEGFESIEIVCTLREQWQFLQSVYIEISRNRAPPRPGQIVVDAIEKGMVDGLWTDYNLLYDHLLEVFPASAIRFYDYDQSRKAEGGVIGTMLRHLDIGLKAGDLAVVNEARSNISPAAIPAWAANLITEPYPAPAWLISGTTQVFQAQFGPQAKSCLFSRDELRRLDEHFAVCNARLAERLAPVQAGFTIQRTPIDGIGVFRDMIGPDFWMQSNRWVFANWRKS